MPGSTGRCNCPRAWQRRRRSGRRSAQEPASYKLRQFLACHRAGAEEALIKIAAAAGEECKLLLAFHALGNDIQSQRFRHVDNAAHDDAAPFRTCNVLGKAAVDLEDRKSTRLNSSHSCAARMPYSPRKQKQN